ncbi:MAG: pilus assembly protein PilP [Thiocapsa sp.]|nr:pilus assembly protein PilP [Thiocapsa sp.]MCG6895709.1 pilus assembly protein PilP [Thiocapsa sp.]MCG6984084.1 pilus assembly protein PilP [Thiocapsa sp.]
MKSRRGHAAGARWWIISFVSVLLGCDTSGMGELRSYIDEVKSRPSAPIEPLPEIAPIDSFVFEPAGRRDPFVMDTQSAAAANQGNSLAPDRTRPKEELESFPLDSLRMVGTLQQEDVRWALVRTREGIVYRVRVGNYLGLNDGQIVDISDDAIRVTEIVSDAPGEWRERPATLALTE